MAAFLITGPIRWRRVGSFPSEAFYGATAGTFYSVEWTGHGWRASWRYDNEGDLLSSHPVEVGTYRDSRSAIDACAAREA
jgi:hypothetical protein